MYTWILDMSLMYLNHNQLALEEELEKDAFASKMQIFF
jgi:hypothetical protein